MNRYASVNRVARIHTARMQKRAMFFDSVKEDVASAFIQSEASKEQKKISSDAKSGLQFLQKRFGLNSIESFVKAIGQSKYDPKDPIQKMVAEAGAKAKSPGEAGDILGRFANAYQKQDIEGMAKAVGVQKETMALVLLWYVKDNKNVKIKNASLNKEAIFWNPFASAPPPPLPFEAQGIMVDKFLSVSGTVISEASHYVGEGISWLWSVIPQGYAPTLPAGKAWSAIYFILNKAWLGIMKAGGLALGLIKAAIVKSTATFGIVSVLKVIGIAFVVYYAILGISWMSYQITRLPSRFLVEFPLKVVWNILKLIGKGTLKLTTWAYDKIKSVVSESKELLEPNDPMMSAVQAV
tara:strand:+ start:944 stop:1999 length:1056 start_codon:yes stop_codon:yes gene_type:complete